MCIAHLFSTVAAFGVRLHAATIDETAFLAATPESQAFCSESLKELSNPVYSLVKESRIVRAELLVITNRRTVLHEVFDWNDRDDPRMRRCSGCYVIKNDK